MTVIALGAGYAETCKSGSGGGSAETAGESQYGAAVPTSHVMNANTSFVCLDPKGELLRDTGNLLKAKGYNIKIIDLINMEKSYCYNPFIYLRSDNDIQRLVTNLFKNTTPKGSQPQDPFWDQAAQMLLLALVFYLHYEAPPEEQNFPMVMEMIRAGEVREDSDDYRSPLDELFDRLEMEKPEHIALKYYRNYRSGSAKTLKSIQITLVARLEKFNLESLAGITQTDEMELWSLGERKTAIFAVIPDNDSSFNFLIGMLYTQLFQQLYYQADVVHSGRLPVHVHFVMDEFANVALPDEFDKLLATMRSREISVSIIIQNLADTKEQLDADTETILTLARSNRCQMAVLKYQQLDGLKTVLSIGVRKINTFRTLTTESLAVFMPFKVQEIRDKGGIYFGENAISHNLIICNKANLLNQSAFLLGVPGSGKSFAAKEQIACLMLNTDDDILISDPEGEYAPLVEAVGDIGTVIHVAAGGKDRLNAMYMVDGYGEGNDPVIVKSQFIMSLVERIDQKGVSPQQKSIIDRCTAEVYREAEKTGITPTLSILREKLAKLLNISAEQMSYVTNADAGCGLIKYGSSLVPFVNRFPRSTKLYQLMTTRPGEGSFSRGQA